MNATHLTIFILISALYINYISNVTFNDIYTTSYIALKLIPLYILYKLVPMFVGLSWYRIQTAFVGLKRLVLLPREQKLACIEAYKFLQRIQDNTVSETKTKEETIAVTNYYNVLNEVLSIADIEKMYIPPLLNENEGLYANQLLCEKAVFEQLDLDSTTMHNSHLLDCGCGRGRIAHLFATFSGKIIFLLYFTDEL